VHVVAPVFIFCVGFLLGFIVGKRLTLGFLVGFFDGFLDIGREVDLAGLEVGAEPVVGELSLQHISPPTTDVLLKFLITVQYSISIRLPLGLALFVQQPPQSASPHVSAIRAVIILP